MPTAFCIALVEEAEERKSWENVPMHDKISRTDSAERLIRAFYNEGTAKHSSPRLADIEESILFHSCIPSP